MADWKKFGRADLLIYQDDAPLAVLELKRGGKPLTDADCRQARSYARILDPSPPLVVVTNGKEVKIVESYSGRPWEPTERSSAEVARLIEGASRLAGEDLKRAVEILLGPDSEIWVTAVRTATKYAIDDQTGLWNEPLLPFVADFLIPRQATTAVLDALRNGERLIIVQGTPLAGKSNVLREVATKTATDRAFAALFIESDSSAGTGIFQQIANLLADTLSWPITADEAREWIRRLANGGGPNLVLLIDGVSPERDDVRKEIEELVAPQFGNRLRILLAADDSVADRLVKTSNDRSSSRIGRRAKRIAVDLLSDEEFKAAAETLDNQRIGMMLGAGDESAFRVPWILRSLGAGVIANPLHDREDVAAAVPALLGLDLIAYTRGRFRDSHALRDDYQNVARGVLADIGEKRPVELELRSTGLFSVRRQALGYYLSETKIGTLIRQRYLKLVLDSSGSSYFIPRLPELLASELSFVIANELVEKTSADAQDAAVWLVAITNALPLGDIIAAQALVDAVAQMDSTPEALFRHLLDTEPKRSSFEVGH